MEKMPEDYYQRLDHFLSKGPPTLRNAPGEGPGPKGKKKSNGNNNNHGIDGGKKPKKAVAGSAASVVPTMPNPYGTVKSSGYGAGAGAGAATKRKGGGASAGGHLDEALLQGVVVLFHFFSYVLLLITAPSRPVSLLTHSLSQRRLRTRTACYARRCWRSKRRPP
jgi:hypothetical protein